MNRASFELRLVSRNSFVPGAHHQDDISSGEGRCAVFLSALTHWRCSHLCAKQGRCNAPSPARSARIFAPPESLPVSPAEGKNRYHPFLADERIVGMKVLLTGANGYIGLRLLPELLAAGHDVFAIARDPRRLPVAEPAGFRQSNWTCWNVRCRFQRMLTLLTISFIRWEVEAISQNARRRLLGILRRLSKGRIAGRSYFSAGCCRKGRNAETPSASQGVSIRHAVLAPWLSHPSILTTCRTSRRYKVQPLSGVSRQAAPSPMARLPGRPNTFSARTRDVRSRVACILRLAANSCIGVNPSSATTFVG